MAGPGQRLRIRFVKGDAIRFSSHLDLARAWARSLRRAGVPLAYSQGFNPRPRVQLAAALPLGHTGLAELIDLWLERPVEIDALGPTLAAALPAGLSVDSITGVDLREPALQSRVVAAAYRVTVESPELREAVEARIAALLLSEHCPIERRGKRVDLRPLIERLSLETEPGSDGELVLSMRLAAGPEGSARPEEVLQALGLTGAFASYERHEIVLSQA